MFVWGPDSWEALENVVPTGASPSKDICCQTGTRECVIFQQTIHLQKEVAWSHCAMPELDGVTLETIKAGVP